MPENHDGSPDEPVVRPVGEAALPGWYRTAAAASWRFLAIAAAIAAVVYALMYLRVVVLPIIVALLASTLLLPLVRWLKGRHVPDALAAAGSMVAAVRVGGRGDGGRPVGRRPVRRAAPAGRGRGPRGERRARRAAVQRQPERARPAVDNGIESLRENGGPLARGVQSGAVLLGEIVTGLIVAVLLTFFLLKDGERMWAYVLSLFGHRSRRDADEIGRRVYTALAGYVRGIALVGLVDAILIGLALVIIGVPLVVPLMVLTFFAAFVPLIGAFVAGLVAVLIALVAGGLVDALLVLGAIILVQQVEGHLLYPVLMSRTVHLHPAVIVVVLAAGGILGGIVGVFLAVPVAGILSSSSSTPRTAPRPSRR